MLRKFGFCEHISSLYEVYETENSLYLVLEHCRGGELMKRIQETTLIRAVDTMNIMKNILKALNQLHLQGVMHRDIKPENILFKSKEG